MTRDDLVNKDPVNYGYVLALIKNAQYTAARQRLMPLIDKEPDRLAYQLALADIELSVGRVKAALDIYEDNQRLYPDDRALTLNQVHALLRTARPAEAAKLLQTQIELGEGGRQIYRLMAQAKGDMGQKSESHAWLAESVPYTHLTLPAK